MWAPSSLLARLARRNDRRSVAMPPSRRRPFFRPAVECLEDRCCPSIALVQNIGTASQTGTFTSLTINVTTPVTAGDTIIAEFATTNTSGGPSVTDSAGNSYTFLNVVEGSPNPGEVAYVASNVHAISAGGSITIHYSANLSTDSAAAAAQEFSGLKSTSPADSQGTNSSLVTPNTTPSVSFTTSNANDLILTGISPNNTTGATLPGFTPGSGYTALTSVTSVNSGNSAIAIYPEFQVVSTSGTQTADGTFNSSSTWLALAGGLEAAPAPTVTGVSPASGPAAGGTTVTITGAGFTGATAVNFGSTPATSFTVNSNTSITATSPAGRGTVDITVVTSGGTSATSAADQFTFTTVATPTPTPAPPPRNGVADLLFLAEDQFALSLDEFIASISSNPAWTQAGDSWLILLNSLAGMTNPALGTGLSGLQAAINANPFFGTPLGDVLQVNAMAVASSLFAGNES